MCKFSHSEIFVRAEFGKFAKPSAKIKSKKISIKIVIKLDFKVFSKCLPISFHIIPEESLDIRKRNLMVKISMRAFN